MRRLVPLAHAPTAGARMRAPEAGPHAALPILPLAAGFSRPTATCRARRAVVRSLLESRRAMRTCRGSPRAAPPATRMPARARRAESSPPSIVGWAAHTKLAWLSDTSNPRSRSASVTAVRSRENTRHAAGDDLRAAAQRLQRTGLGDLRDAQVGLQLGQQLLRSGPPDCVAYAQPRQTPGLGEAAHDKQARVLGGQIER